jgi:hypothetical protein
LSVDHLFTVSFGCGGAGVVVWLGERMDSFPKQQSKSPRILDEDEDSRDEGDLKGNMSKSSDIDCVEGKNNSYVEENKQRERTPYLKIFKESLEYIKDKQTEIFTSEELIWCQKIELLSELSQCLLARIILRDGRWHRFDKLLKCVPRGEENPQQSLEDGLNGLFEYGFLDKLSPKTPFNETWTIVSNCLVMDELKVLHERISKVKSKGFVNPTSVPPHHPLPSS